MAVKIRIAKQTGRKLRVGAFGKDSVGKTHLGLSAGRRGRVLAFDSEGRIDCMTDTFGPIPIVEYDERRIIGDLLEAAREVRAGTLKNAEGEPFDAFLTDSWTTIEKQFEQSCGIDTISDYKSRVRNLGDVRKRIENEILNPMLIGPTKCHIIVTAHEANEWEKSGQRIAGSKPDATRNWKHYFDFVLHMQKDAVSAPGQPVVRYATVVKSNYQHVLPIGSKIPNFSWELPVIQAIIADEVELVGVPTKELIALHATAGTPAGTLGEWLKTAGFVPVDGKLAKEDSHTAKSMLQGIIDDLKDMKELSA